MPISGGPSVQSLGVHLTTVHHKDNSILRNVNVEPSTCWTNVNIVMNLQVT